MFTGDPGYDWDSRVSKSVLNPFGNSPLTYTEEPNKYRAGIISFGIGNHKFGVSSDYARHFI